MNFSKTSIFISFFLILFLNGFQVTFAQNTNQETAAVNPLVTQLQETLSTLIDTQEEFNKTTTGVEKVTKRISYLVRKVNLFLVFGTQNKCRRGIKLTMAKLEIIILKLEKKHCKCIDAQIFDNFFPQVKELLENAKQIFEIDNDGDKIPDVCKQ